MALAEVSTGVLDHVGAFAGSVSDEEDRTLFKVFCVAGFIDDCRGCLGDLLAVFEYCCIYFHSSGIDHRYYISVCNVRFSFCRRGLCLSDKSIQRSHGEKRFARSEAESFSCRYTHAQTGVGSRTHAHADCITVGQCHSAFCEDFLHEDCSE